MLSRLNRGKTSGSEEEFDETMGDTWDESVMQPFEEFLHLCFHELDVTSTGWGCVYLLTIDYS